MTKRTLVKRVRRKGMGGSFDMRIYDDGTCRVRCDHPSNDPEIEMAMAGRVLRLARERFAELGMEIKMQPTAWHDDP